MNSSQIEKSSAKILVVDDTIDSLRLLANMLNDQGYNVRKVLNGQMALTAAQSAPPDLILLDINMPQMNGYEVCQTLKSNLQTADIPVIFISALDEVLDKVKAFTVGGIDYITKPFQFEEVVARVETQLAIRSLQQQLAKEKARAEWAETQYNYHFEHSKEGLFQMTQDGLLKKVNLALAQLHGYESPEKMLLKLNNQKSLLYVEPHRWLELMAILQEEDFILNFESQVYCSDKRIINISESIRVVRDAQKKLCYYEGTVVVN